MAGTRRFWAPGRVNLIGEHTDYTGGLVLPAALDLGVLVEGTAAGRISLVSDRSSGQVETSADGGELDAQTGWGRYVAAVAAELAILGRSAVGFSGRIRSNLPIGAGLSSSAALEIASGLALCGVSGFELDPLELARAGQRAELRAVGVPCGILDQAAAVLGREDHAILIDTATLEHRAVPLPAAVAIVVVDSGVSHRHEDSAYAARRRELEEGIRALGGAGPREVTVAEAEARLDRAGVTGAPARRLRHVVSENRRVSETVSILSEPGNPRLAGLGRLFRESHESLRDDFEVSIPELDLLVELAYASGALAARMTGGGFGGSIVVLADRERAVETGASIVEAFRVRAGGSATARVCRASAGARELT